MEIIDISRELMTAPVYPGDPVPRMEAVSRIAYGDACNLSGLYACLHNGTHADAPRHFIEGGADAASIPLQACIGECSVVEFSGLLLGEQAEKLLPYIKPRLLLKGDALISPSAAFVLSDAGLLLLGVEGASVSPPECISAVHRQLLGGGMVLLEGLDLTQAEEDTYFLFAPPLKVGGADGASVRALLLRRYSLELF